MNVDEQERQVADDDLDFLNAEPTPSNVVIIDRSTAERYAACPAQGLAVERKLCITASAAADSGNLVHHAISVVTCEIVEGRILKPQEARDYALDVIRRGRPDISSDAAVALAKSAYAIFSHLLYWENGDPRHQADLIRYDGGIGDRSGQMGHDLNIDGAVARITGEADLLLATRSPEVLELCDWKSGWAVYNEDDIWRSFQLGTWYPALVMLNYPSCNMVRVRVWNTRTSLFAPAVEFRRASFLQSAVERIRAACETHLKYRDGEFATTPTWPAMDKCAICNAAAICPEARGFTRDVATDPVAAVKQLAAMEAAVAAMYANLEPYIDKNGPIVTDIGTFGRDHESKPKKKPAKLYDVPTVK